MSVSIQPSATAPIRRAPAAAKRLRLLLGSSALVAVTLAVPALALLANTASAQTFGGNGGSSGFSGGTGGGDGMQGGQAFIFSSAGAGGGGAAAAGGNGSANIGGAAGVNGTEASATGTNGGEGVGGSGGGGGGNGLVSVAVGDQTLTGTFAGGAGGSTAPAPNGVGSGGGGAGGSGLKIDSAGLQTFTFSSAYLQGGAGGATGDVYSVGAAVGAGAGGGGGIGLLVGTDEKTLVIDEGTNVRGGAGGAGGNGMDVHASGGNGGAGGAGIYVVPGLTGSEIYNAGSIVGGGGGAGGVEGGGPAWVAGGASGSGIQGDDVYIQNTGLISADRSENGAAGNGITGNNLSISNLAGGSIAGGETGAEALAGNGISTNNSTIINAGTILGGPSEVGGGAGIAIVGNDLSIVNSGFLVGGFDSNSLLGGIAIQMGGTTNRLEIRAGSQIIGMVNATGTTNTLAFGGTTDQSFGVGALGVQYRGFNALEKTGSASLKLSGTTTAATPWNVREGTLSVAGTIGGMVNVFSGARLVGIGTVGAASVASGGTVATGSPTNILSVAANMSFAAGSTYEVQTAGTAQASLLSVGGIATLGGAGVSVTSFDDTVNYGGAGYTYRILQAGSLSGEFSPTVLINSAFLTPTLSYTLNAVNLTLAMTRATPEFGAIAQTANQRATADALEALDQTAGSDSLALYNALLLSSADEARAAFDQLSGEGHASLGTALMADSGLTRDAVGDRLRAAFGEGEFPAGEGDAAGRDYGHGMVGWGRIHGSWGSTDGSGNAAGIERDTAGFLLGVDTLVGDIARIGVMAGYATSNVDVPGRSFSSEIGSATVGLYGGTELAGIGISGGVSHSWQQIDTTRVVSIGGFANTLTADYDARTTQVFGEVGYKIRTAAAVFEPFAALAYVHLDSDGFTETGGAAALSSGGGSDDATFATIGARATTGFMLGSMAARANASLAWQHAFGDLAPLTTVALAGGNGFIVAGAPMARDAALVSLGLDMDVTETTVLGVSYGGQYGDGTTNHEARLDLSVRF